MVMCSGPRSSKVRLRPIFLLSVLTMFFVQEPQYAREARDLGQVYSLNLESFSANCYLCDFGQSP